VAAKSANVISDVCSHIVSHGIILTHPFVDGTVGSFETGRRQEGQVVAMQLFKRWNAAWSVRRETLCAAASRQRHGSACCEFRITLLRNHSKKKKSPSTGPLAALKPGGGRKGK
jgi:hypothetical protein